MQGSERVPVPVLEVDRFIGWIRGGTHPCVELSNRQLRTVTDPAQLVDVVAQAINRGCRWLLIDGPRPVRNYWILDPWWTEEPEMTVSLQTKTHARRVALVELQDAITPPSTDSLAR